MSGRPEADEIEISVFGRGYGEAILIHYGGGAWFAIDCLNDATGEPASLAYLQSIGVSPEAVTELLATHWHDDHVRGLARAYEAFTNAEFFLSIALDKDEWRAFNQKNRVKSARRVSSGLRELRSIAAAQAGGRPSAKYAVANRVIKRVAGSQLPHGADISFEALGPCDADVKAFLKEISASPAGQVRVVPFEKNDVSVPVWLRVGKHRILLGADLEVVPQPDRGWNAVFSSGAQLDGAAALVKIAHHGSKNGHHDGIWSDHVTADAWAILSPWNRGTKLPTQEDISRITARTTKAYATSRFDRNSPVRPAVVSKTLKQFDQKVRARPADVGQARVRFKPSEDPTSWQIELVDGALKLDALSRAG